jgi:hypothetical protein
MKVNSEGDKYVQPLKHNLTYNSYYSLLLVGLLQTLHTSSLIMFQTYTGSKIYDSDYTYKDAIFMYSLSAF